MRQFVLVLAAVAALAVAGVASGASSGTQFAIVGGSVTLHVDQGLLGALAADGATISAGGGATLTKTKTQEVLVRFPVVRDSRGQIELKPHCRCVQIPMRGSLVFSGSGTAKTWTGPVINLDGLQGNHRMSMVYEQLQTTVAKLSGVTLPRSLAGRTFTAQGIAATFYTTGLPPLYAVAPSTQSRSEYTLGRLDVQLKLKPRG